MNEILTAIQCLNWPAILSLIPELVPLEKQEQPTEFHLGNVLEHTKLVVEHMVKKGWNDPALLLSALLHDLGKPAVAAMDAKKNRITFYKHMTVSAEQAAPILDRIGVPDDVKKLAIALISRHELNYEANWGDSAVRKLIEECGNLEKLVILRQADLAGQRPGPHVEIEHVRLANLIERVKTMKPAEVKRQKIAVHPFAVGRHTPESQHSHFEGTWDELRALVGKAWKDQRPGYKPGIIMVPVDPSRFRTSVAKLTPEMKLVTTFAPRVEGEELVLETYAVGQKAQAARCDVVLYSHDVLAADNDTSSDAEYEVITLLAWPDQEVGPMPPVTMARNALGKKGGTSASFKAKAILESIWYWTTHVNVKPA